MIRVGDATDEKMTAGRAQRNLVVGIASFGCAMNGSEQNPGDESVVYTNVNYYLDWIVSTVNEYPAVRSEHYASLSLSWTVALRPVFDERGRSGSEGDVEEESVRGDIRNSVDHGESLSV